MGLSIIYLNPESWSGTVLNRKVVPFFTGAEKECCWIFTTTSNPSSYRDI
jgi:hypothetical protein